MPNRRKNLMNCFTTVLQKVEMFWGNVGQAPFVSFRSFDVGKCEYSHGIGL